jgi:pimeloyl-ACP methyl ester carboxylesterase
MKIWLICVSALLLALTADAKDVTVRVNGRAVHLDVISPEQMNPALPTLVFESGLGDAGTEGWKRLRPLLPSNVQVVWYDRPGFGTSEDDGQTPTPRYIASLLHATLAAANVKPPYILIGHSLGGVRIRTFASIYPTDVAGLVFVDPTPDFTRTREDDFRDLFVALGLGRKEQAEMTASPLAAPEGQKPLLAELRMAEELAAGDFAEIRTLPPLADIPVVVLVGESDAEWPTSNPRLSFDLRAWTNQWLRVRNASLNRFALSLRQGTFVSTPYSSHALQNSEPELVAWAIGRVLARLSTR